MNGKQHKPAIKYHFRGHTLLTWIGADGRRSYQCDSLPGLAERYEGTTDPGACREEFERRASGGAVAADDEAKGAA